jgi:hypothetical protein
VSPSDSRTAAGFEFDRGSTCPATCDHQTQKLADWSVKFFWRHILALFDNGHRIELSLRFRSVRVDSQIATDLAVRELAVVIFNDVVHVSAAGSCIYKSRAKTIKPCGFSKLNPQGFIGGFERMAIACLHGDANKRSAAARPPRTPNPNCAAVGRDRAAPSNCRAGAQRNSSPVLSPLGSAVLDLVLALVAPMARQPDHRPARDRLALAP